MRTGAIGRVAVLVLAAVCAQQPPSSDFLSVLNSGVETLYDADRSIEDARDSLRKADAAHALVESDAIVAEPSDGEVALVEEEEEKPDVLKRGQRTLRGLQRQAIAAWRDLWEEGESTSPGTELLQQSTDDVGATEDSEPEASVAAVEAEAKEAGQGAMAASREHSRTMQEAVWGMRELAGEHVQRPPAPPTSAPAPPAQHPRTSPPPKWLSAAVKADQAHQRDKVHATATMQRARKRLSAAETAYKVLEDEEAQEREDAKELGADAKEAQEYTRKAVDVSTGCACLPPQACFCVVPNHNKDMQRERTTLNTPFAVDKTPPATKIAAARATAARRSKHRNNDDDDDGDR